MTSGAKRLVGAKRPGGKRPGGKRLGGETTRGGNGLGAKRPGFGIETVHRQDSSPTRILKTVHRQN